MVKAIIAGDTQRAVREGSASAAFLGTRLTEHHGERVHDDERQRPGEASDGASAQRRGLERQAEEFHERGLCGVAQQNRGEGDAYLGAGQLRRQALQGTTHAPVLA
ncbi:hypothetical protein GCM10025876_27720 [Demequina litorisediminis]|uniref:Uncharacterized protein n=1 Tax=Demequina litorisediminis TaxID=1849022 RepID=A0ABQ6IHD2_9MICO|nr:hypothetical protein GCM10025876_27720 [Demequina litorisediminis]